MHLTKHWYWYLFYCVYVISFVLTYILHTVCCMCKCNHIWQLWITTDSRLNRLVNYCNAKENKIPFLFCGFRVTCCLSDSLKARENVERKIQINQESVRRWKTDIQLVILLSWNNTTFELKQYKKNKYWCIFIRNPYIKKRLKMNYTKCTESCRGSNNARQACNMNEIILSVSMKWVHNHTRHMTHAVFISGCQV